MENINMMDKSEETSLVTDCAATICKFNEEKHCTAGQIKLIVFEGKPECGTFDPESEEKQ